ncbi:glycoside hydrolase family 26 protein [Povalibacter sp.]|uniref:glycoside hydrolase family 26 protein n=1 Tax=Povalibacter sp. TaxID=1962978 RepID=UPI002F3E2FC6
MKRRTLIASLVAAGSLPALRNLVASEPRAPQLLGSASPARLGVYLGAGCTGTERLPEYQRWLQRDVDQTLEFVSWDVLKAAGTWGIKCWNTAGQKTVVYSLPMLPPDHSAKLSDGAAGKFDDLFSRYATQLVKWGFGESVIRIGWEFNANWYTWDASKDPQSWIAYWRRIVETMRKTPGASFQYDWCPAAAASGFVADKAYPGDDYVDIVGLDFYNMPIGKDNSPEGRWAARMEMQHGLKWQRDFAHAHGKPISMPEWGTGVHKKWGGPADDPYFIDRMAAWISDNPVAYHNYWEYWAKDFDTRLAGGRQPEASAAYLRHFGGSAAHGASAASAKNA